MKLSEYVLQIVNDPKYGHDIEWVKGNLHRAHIEQIEATRDAEEPGWEYLVCGYRGRGLYMAKTLAEAQEGIAKDRARSETKPKRTIMRRRKAGPWERVDILSVMGYTGTNDEGNTP